MAKVLKVARPESEAWHEIIFELCIFLWKMPRSFLRYFWAFLFCQGQILAVWILAAKLPNSDLKFAVDYWVDFSKKKRPPKIHWKSPHKIHLGICSEKFPSDFCRGLFLIFCGSGKVPQNSRQISRNISLPKIEKNNHRRASAGAQAERALLRCSERWWQFCCVSWTLATSDFARLRQALMARDQDRMAFYSIAEDDAATLSQICSALYPASQVLQSEKDEIRREAHKAILDVLRPILSGPISEPHIAWCLFRADSAPPKWCDNPPLSTPPKLCDTPRRGT